jgi:hypothetical protein
LRVPLGDLQKEILKTIAETSQPLVAFRISEALGKSNQAVYTSVDSLLTNKILSFIEEEGKKFLKLTDKGACYAYFYCNISYVKSLFNHRYLKRPIEVQMIEDIIADNEYYDTDRKSRHVYKQSLYERIFDLIIQHDEFDSDGSFLHKEDTLATIDDRTIGAIDYARRILRVLGYLVFIHPPHHGDWCNTEKMIYYRDLARKYFNSYIRFINGKLTFF